ncbi:hypothetical protein BV22DRAFT_1051512 [Leucogyrophana mollusca]|uniref:Uncharacterized protein n=1 Tax=Leucogyrophana mollusca TaxID=85980 RepID=A0ACB8AZD7_9AGAM|nr:hypothetical protein BV22DRAFT_1051512 [Leucogyrophana mollusca]
MTFSLKSHKSCLRASSHHTLKLPGPRGPPGTQHTEWKPHRTLQSDCRGYWGRDAGPVPPHDARGGGSLGGQGEEGDIIRDEDAEHAEGGVEGPGVLDCVAEVEAVAGVVVNDG